MFCIPEVSPQFARLRCAEAKQGRKDPAVGTKLKQHSKKRSRARSSTVGQHCPGRASIKPLLLLRNAVPAATPYPVY